MYTAVGRTVELDPMHLPQLPGCAFRGILGGSVADDSLGDVLPHNVTAVSERNNLCRTLFNPQTCFGVSF